MKKLSISLIILSLLTSCTFVGTKKSINVMDQKDHINLGDSFYLIYPKNGFHKVFLSSGLKENKKSAKEVINTLNPIFLERLGSLTISSKNENLEEGIKNAKLEGSQYLIKIDINEWKDAFYMLCKPIKVGHNPDITPSTFDTVDVTMSVYDVKNEKLINRQRLKNKGCPIVLLEFIPIGKNSPESRLESMIEKWLNNLGN